MSVSWSTRVTLALALMAGCGRVGYDPVTLLVGADSGQDVGGREGPAADRAAADGLAADVVDRGAPDVPDAPPVVDLRADMPPDLSPPPPDLMPDAGPMAIDGIATCLAAPAPRDLIHDFEDGTLQLPLIDGRGRTFFHLVNSGSGELTVGTTTSQMGACGSPLFMRLRGMDVPAGRNGHIQALFVEGPTGTNRDYDARVFSGIRVSLRATSPQVVRMKLPDGQTTASTAYDHFSIDLNVTNSWRTYVVPFTSLRQLGTGPPRLALDLQSLLGIEFQTPERDFDVWIDTVAFTR